MDGLWGIGGGTRLEAGGPTQEGHLPLSAPGREEKLGSADPGSPPVGSSVRRTEQDVLAGSQRGKHKHKHIGEPSVAFSWVCGLLLSELDTEPC